MAIWLRSRRIYQAMIVCLLASTFHAFSVCLPKKHRAGMVLWYRNQPQKDEPSQHRASTRTSLPVLHPILNQGPLLPGDTLKIQSPTPMQWQSIETSVKKHVTQANQLAAPMLALLDDCTVLRTDASRYATLVTVSGYTNLESPVYQPGLSTTTAPQSVELLAIGRAVVSDLYYESLQEVDEEGYLLIECDLDDTRHECDILPDKTVVAHFQLLVDTVQASPAHALAEQGRLLNRLQHLHSLRQYYVAQLEQQEHPLIDHDGLGKMLGFGTTLEDLDRYGLGTGRTSVCTVRQLTEVSIDTLRKFYSPETLQSEEFYYQMASFRAMEFLQDYLQVSHKVWALRCTCTSDRLRHAVLWMESHVQGLKKLLGE